MSELLPVYRLNPLSQRTPAFRRAHALAVAGARKAINEANLTLTLSDAERSKLLEESAEISKLVEALTKEREAHGDEID